MMRVSALPGIAEFGRAKIEDLSTLVYSQCYPSLDNAITLIDWLLQIAHPEGMFPGNGHVQGCYAKYTSISPLSLTIEVGFKRYSHAVEVRDNLRYAKLCSETISVIELRFDSLAAFITFANELVERDHGSYTSLNMKG